MNNFLIKQLAIAANMSERQVIKYRTMHYCKGWCGNWIAAFLDDFVNTTDEGWEANYQELREWWEWYADPQNVLTVEEQFRAIVLWKLRKTNKEHKLLRKRFNK